MLQILQSQNYDLQYLTRLCALKAMKGENERLLKNHSTIYYLMTLK
jgi:hypothetical protein